MNDITIRPIQPTDNTAMAAIVRRVLKSFNAAKPGTAYYDANLNNLYDVFRTKGSAYWVAEHHGEILGGGGIYPTGGLPAGYCELVKLYLDEGARGKGIGRQLINTCIQTAIKLGYTHLYLETMPELTIAVPLYEKLGFTYIDAPLGNSGHTDCNIWMVKKLDV